MTTDAQKPNCKPLIDAIVLKFPGATTKKINGLDAYFVKDRMFACINGNGVGLRVPAAMARDLQFSRENVSPFHPAGLPSSKEWVQIERADVTEYEKDAEIFLAAYDFVKSQGR
ncbi:hypothetical protein BWI17_21340 [Betaproteobacteria bacterium GR16-43]|nr:hypothetical protein BWI17_21340 [Betaproteobacteria bacterium GR16-43]